MIRPFESRLWSFSFRTNLAACQNGCPLPARRRRRSRPLPNARPLLPRPHAAAVRARVRASSGRTPDALSIDSAPAPGGRRTSSPSPSPPPCRLRHRRVFTRTAQPSDSSVQGKNGSIAGRPHHRGRASSGRTPDALAIAVAVAFVRPLSTHRSATACQAPCPPHRRAPPGVQVSL